MNVITKTGFVVLGLILGGLANSAVAGPGGIAINVGGGEDSIDLYRLDLVGNQWQRSWFEAGDWHVTGNWELGLAAWDGDTNQGRHENLYELSLTSVLRLQPKVSGAWTPYVEGGVGVHLLSHTSVDQRDFGTALQFGSLIGTGLRFGDQNRFEIGYRYQHVSNASLNSDNDGMDFHMLRLAYYLP